MNEPKTTQNLLKVLITNDDGVNSELMLSLAYALSEICEVTVAAPDSQKSGISHAFSGSVGLQNTSISLYPFSVYAISGTPVDAVKFAVCQNLCKGTPDFIISGINPGENSGVSSIYSGTLGGAREGALWGIPSMALSLKGNTFELKDKAIAFAKNVVLERLFEGMTPYTFWNVNFPKGNVSFKGVTFARMAVCMFSDHYVLHDGAYFLEGEKAFAKAPIGTDDRALFEGYAVITPHKIDQTSIDELERIKSLNFNTREA